jgi:hypothetical protein
MTNTNRFEQLAHPGLDPDRQPDLGAVPAVTTGEPPAEQVAGGQPIDPSAARQPVRHGLLEQVFFDGSMQLQLWWEGEGHLHPAAIELR